ncbi:MAG: hypothetical protein WD995_12755 [Gemmatimonadota bacterium]
MQVTTLTIRVLVLLLAATAAAGQLAYMDALAWHVLTPGGAGGTGVRPTVLTMAVAHAVLSVVSGAAAVVLAFRDHEREPGGRGLSLAIGAWSYLLAYPGIVVLFRPDPGVSRMVFEGHFLLVETLGLAGLVRFTTLFPRKLVSAELTSQAEGSWLATFLRPLRSALLRPGVVWTIAFMVPAVLFGVSLTRGTPIADAGLAPLMDLLRVAAAAAVVLNLRDAWARSDPAERPRLSWLLTALSALIASVLLVIGGNILLSATSWPDPSIAWRPILLDLGVLGFVLGLAATQIAPERLDAILVARRIAGGVGLGMTLLLSATILEVLLSSGLFGPVALPAGLGAAMAAAAVGSVSAPLLRFFDRLLDQWPGFGTGGLATG